MPELSICIAIKNRSRVEVDGRVLNLFPNCVKSIRAAWRPGDDWQIVVGDFESDDWPLKEWIHDAAAPIPVKIVTIKAPFSSGMGFNRAIDAADGQAILILGGDMMVDRYMMVRGMKHVRNGLLLVCMPTYCYDPEHKKREFSTIGVGINFMPKRIWQKVGPHQEFHSYGLQDTVWMDRALSMLPNDMFRFECCPGLVHQWHPQSKEFQNRYYPNWKEDDQRKRQMPFIKGKYWKAIVG